MGLGTYFGNLVSQNGKGHLLGHVKDLGEDSSKIDEVRIYRTNAKYVILFFSSSFLLPKKNKKAFWIRLFIVRRVSFVIENISRILLIPLFSFPPLIQPGNCSLCFLSRLGLLLRFPLKPL